MPYDRTQLANRALEKLRIVGLGQSPEAEDTEKVDDKIDAFAAWISEAHVYTIADLDEIDDAPFEWVADLLAWLCAPDFQKPRDAAMRSGAEYELRRITAGQPSGETQKAEYF